MKLILITVALLTLSLASRSEETVATKLLKERSKALLPTITQVSKSVYCASGYSPANISMIIGTEGIVIVDTGMFPDHARAVMKEFRKVTQLLVAGVILTQSSLPATTSIAHGRTSMPSEAPPIAMCSSGFAASK